MPQSLGWETEMTVNPLQALLTPHVGEIRKATARGDKNAQQVIDLYNMYVRLPEAGAATLCECFFNDWMRSRK